MHPLNPYLPWTDRKGGFDPLKAAIFAALLVPAAVLAWRALAGGLGPKPVTAAIHESGDWAIRFLALSLLVTPLRLVLERPALLASRRMIGLASLAYAVLHFTLYCADQGWVAWRIASEIVLRVYLLIGFVALLGLIALGSTSTDGAIRRLGAQTWQRLHRLAYPIAGLAAVHYVLQSKADVTQAVLIAGFLLALFGYRLLKARGRHESPLALVGLAVAAGLATALVEIAWYGLATGVPAARIARAHLDFSYAIRPAYWVALATTALALLRAVRLLVPRAARPPRVRA